MKKLLIIFIFSVIIQGCEDEDGERKSIFFRFIIKNESSKNIKISLFYPNDSLFKEIYINSNDSTIADEGIVTIVGGSTFSLTKSIDSAVILFEDGKSLIQTSGSRINNDTINNILSPIFYKSLTPKESVKNEVFILNENDYLRAK